MIKAQRGFTVVEVIIFLAISAFMFTIGFIGTRSQQDSVAFRQSINSIELKLREIFNNVDNGYFGNAGNYICISGAENADWITTGSGGGSSYSCLFLGKLVYFSADGKNMNIDTILGKRSNNDTSSNHSALKEVYAFQYNVKYTHTKEGLLTRNYMKIAAARDKNEAGASDIRATRYFYDSPLNNWNKNIATIIPVTESDSPMLCFEFNGKKASIKITQKDLIVSYTGVGC